MNGARKLAFDYILPLIKGDEMVLDVGAGASPLASILAGKGCQVTAIDKDGESLAKAWEEAGKNYTICVADLGEMAFYADNSFDLIVAVYSIQHMLGKQAYVWSQVARMLKPGGKFIFVGRYDERAPQLENNRRDPLISDNGETIRTMANACGLISKSFIYQYEGDSYIAGMTPKANAIIGDMVKP